MREEIFLPLGMDDCWVGMPTDRRGKEYGDRIGTMHNTQGEAPVPLDLLDSADTLAKCIPGGGGRRPDAPAGPASTACCSVVVSSTGVRILSPQTVEAMSVRHRVGLFDETFHCECDWGLGVAVDNFAMGAATPRRGAFGHGGAVCRRTRSPIPNTISSWRSRPTGCVRATTTIAVWTRR